MKMRLAIIFALLLVAGPAGPGQTKDPSLENKDLPQKQAWSFALNVSGYLVPHDRSYASPTFAADQRHAHLEARYNYEDFETGSLWAGYNFAVDKKLSLEVTPMLGGVFGNTNGIAPGYEFALGYKALSLTSDGEYVITPANTDNSFFYAWNEFVYSPAEWFHAGLVAQRTRAYSTGLDVQRGFSVGFAHKAADFTVYTFNLGWTDPTVVLNLGLKF